MAINFIKLKRDELLTIIREALNGADYDVMNVKSNILAIPVVLDDDDKTEGAFTVTVSYKKGSREGEIYDPYAEAKAYEKKLAEDARKAEELRKKKEADQRKREEEKRKREEAKQKKEAGKAEVEAKTEE